MSPLPAAIENPSPARPFVALLAIVPALAQDTATSTGTVTDSTGAVVANAKATATKPLRTA
jgi:hypothetical protein